MSSNYQRISVAITLVIGLASCSLYKDTQFIDEFEPIDLFELVRNQDDDLWLIQFYSKKPEMVEVASNYSAAARSMLGYVRLAAIDVDRHKYIRLALGISQTPTYCFYGFYKHLPDRFVSLRSVTDLHEEATQQLVRFFVDRSVFRFVLSKHNVEISSADVKLATSAPWMLVFYARDHPRCVDFVPTWERLIDHYHERIRFASHNDDMHQTLSIFNASAFYPIVHFYASGHHRNATATFSGFNSSYSELSHFLDAHIKPSQVYHLTSQKVFQKCFVYTFCIFTFLPVTELQVRQPYVRILEQVSENWMQRAWIWFYSVVGEQPGLETIFGIKSQANDNATLVALNVHASIFLQSICKLETLLNATNTLINNILKHSGFVYLLAANTLPDIRQIGDPDDVEPMIARTEL